MIQFFTAVGLVACTLVFLLGVLVVMKVFFGKAD